MENPFKNKNNKKTPQETVWDVERKVDQIQKDLSRASDSISSIESSFENLGSVFENIREGQEDDAVYRTQTQEQLVGKVVKLQKELHETALRIQILRMNRKSFWTKNRAALLCFVLTVISGLASAYLRLSYDGVYSAWLFWFAALSAICTMLFVAGAAFRKDE